MEEYAGNLDKLKDKIEGILKREVKDTPKPKIRKVPYLFHSINPEYSKRISQITNQILAQIILDDLSLNRKDQEYEQILDTIAKSIPRKILVSALEEQAEEGMEKMGFKKEDITLENNPPLEKDSLDNQPIFR